MHIESKLPQVETTIFTVMSQLAAKHNAINLSQGFPDFNPPPALIESVSEAMRAGVNQYAPMTGLPALRVAIAAKSKLLYQADIDSDQEITVTSGATEALFCAISAIVHSGDEVIIFDPAYDSYEPVISLCGGRAVRIAMHFPDYHIDWDQVKNSITKKTRAIIINSPHNPTGKILDQTDIQFLKDLTAKFNLFIISDEVYEHIIFDQKPHLSMLLDETLRQRSFVISSFGKTYHCTGWKLGYCIAPPVLSAEFRKIHQYNTFASVAPMQHGFAKLLGNAEHYLQLPSFYQQKRDYLLKKMQPSRFKPLACHGTYFQLFDYSALSKDPDTAYAKYLTEKIGVATIPISVFFGNKRDDKVLRICFAKNDSTIDAATEILCKI